MANNKMAKEFNVLGEVIPKGISWADWEDICENVQEENKIPVENAWSKPLYPVKKKDWTEVKVKKKVVKPTSTIFKNETKKCRICEKDFVFTIEEQFFFKEKGYKPRTICKSCKRVQKTMGKMPDHRRKKVIQIN